MSNQQLQVPVVDFGKFWTGSQADRLAISRDVVKAFKDIGFMYISNHPIDQNVIDKVFQESSDFFALPDSIKDQLAWRDPKANRGYVKQGRELVTNSTDPDEIAELRRTAPDVKESMEIGLETDPTYRNQWPPIEMAPQFRSTMINFYDICHKLHVDVLRAVALGLGMDEHYFDSLNDQSWHTLRLLNYPPVARQFLAGEGRARAGAHSGAVSPQIESIENPNHCGRFGYHNFCIPRRREFHGQSHSLSEFPCAGGRPRSAESAHTRLYTSSPHREWCFLGRMKQD